MIDDDDLHVNTLHRFAKHSDKLVLEEHSHCEVPAGCGGVLIRWRNPDVSVPVILYLAGPGRCHVYVDGTLMHSGRMELVFGTRTLLFHITQIGEQGAPEDDTDQADGPRLFAAVARRADLHQGHEPGPLVPGLQTTDDGSWLVTVTNPASAAASPGDWRPLLTADESAAIPESHRWAFQRAREHGAGTLVLPADSDELWVQKTVIIEPTAAGGEP